MGSSSARFIKDLRNVSGHILVSLKNKDMPNVMPEHNCPVGDGKNGLDELSFDDLMIQARFCFKRSME
jgi:hypothetical protein